MTDHCHACGVDESLDEAARTCVDLLAIDRQLDPDTTGTAEVYLRDYINYRRAGITAKRLPKIDAV